MVEIPLLVLVLQIGFNVALNRNINPRFTPSSFVNSGKTRRFSDSDRYSSWSSRGIPGSNSEQSDSVYSSFEDYDFRSGRARHSRSFHDLTDKNQPDYDVSSGLDGFGSSVGRNGPNSYSKSLQSSTSIPHQAHLKYRRSYKPRLRNRKRGRSLKKYKQFNDDISSYVSSMETSYSDDFSREEDHRLFFEELNNRRDYYKFRDQSLEELPFDKWNDYEDDDNSLPSIPHQRRKNRKEYERFRLRQPSTAKNILGAYDTILLVTDDDTSDEPTSTKPKLRSSSLEDSVQNEDNRRYSNHKAILRLLLSPNYVTLDEGSASHLSKLLSKTLNTFNFVPVYLRTGPSNRNTHRKENYMRSAEDNEGSLDIPNTKSSLRSNRDRGSSDVNLRRSGNDLEYLKQLIKHDPPNNLVSYDKSENRRNNKQCRDEDFPDEFNIDTLFDFDKQENDDDEESQELTDNLSVLRSIKENNLNFEPSQSSNENPWKNEFPWNDQLDLNKTQNSSNVTSLRNLDLELKKMPKETKNTTGLLRLEYPWNDQVSPVKSNKPSVQTSLRSQSQLQNQDQKDNRKNNDTTDLLHLEFPWNDQLGPDGDNNNSSVSAPYDPDSQLRSQEKRNKTNNIADFLHLDFPWNGKLSTAGNKHSNNLSALYGHNSQVKNQEKRNKTNSFTDLLHLEFPWNDQGSSDGNKHSRNRSAIPGLDSQLKNHEKMNDTNNTTDLLHLEFPWNDQLSPDDVKKSKLSIFTRPASEPQLTNPELKGNNNQQRPNETKPVRLRSQPKDEFKLESPEKRKKTILRTPDPLYLHPYLRSRNFQKPPSYFTRSFNDVNEGVSLFGKRNDKVPPSPSSTRLDNKQSLRVLPTSIENKEKDADKEIDSYEIFPFPLGRRPQRLRTLTENLW